MKITGKDDPYRIAVYGASSGVTLLPSSRVRNYDYQPSSVVEQQIADMWKQRKPRVVGLVSELMATEILDKGRVIIEGLTWTLACGKLRNMKEVADCWRPSRGIYCDDLAAIAKNHWKRQLFLAEVKGTISDQGLSHTMEAKMFYQLARTCVTLGKLMPNGPSLTIKGVFTVAIIHSRREITLNVLNETAARGYFPDRWLYPSARTYA